jgi:periplasmic copper chaperone A
MTSAARRGLLVRREFVRRRTLAVAVAATLVIAAGCGSDDDSSAPTAETATTETATTETATDGTATAETAATAPADDGDDAGAELPVAHDAWVRMPAMGQTVAAGYVTFVNGGDTDLAFTSVRTSLAEAELHETIADDEGVMRMQERPDGFVVPANGEFVMAPGGAHVMLLGVDPLDMATLDDVELVFDFGTAGELTVVAEIRRDTSMHDDEMHDGDEHGEMHDEMHSTMPDGEAAALDPHALHALDDELHMGVYEPERQRELVASSLAALDRLDEVPDGVDVERLRDALIELDAALEAGDLDAAKALAFEVHDLTHALVPHDPHDHSHDH